MKYIITADWHFSGYNQDKKDTSTNLSERLYFLINAVKNMIEYCRENKIDKVIVAGDIFHNKSIIHTIALASLTEILINTKDIQFIFIDGNHDLEGKGEGSKSGLIAFDSLSNVNRIGTEVGHYFDEDNDILYVPYSNNMVDIIKKNSAKILVSHLGLNEGILNSGQSIIADIGMKSLTGKYELVLLGHYHTPQEIIKDNISIYYPGSLIQLNWNDKNEEKRLLVLDTDDMSIESIPTDGYKKYVELEITNETKHDIINQAKELQEQGHHVHIKKKEILDTQDIENDFIIIDKTEKDITNRGIDSSMSEKEIIEKYLDIKEIKKEEHEEYLKVGLDIINSVVEE